VGHAGLAGVDVPGSKRLTVSDWGGAPITLWYLRGANTSADAPIVFVMHGVGRDADRYLAEWRDIALANELVVVVPEYAQDHFPVVQATTSAAYSTSPATCSRSHAGRIRRSSPCSMHCAITKIWVPSSIGYSDTRPAPSSFTDS
ncbi:MAG: hypothetical protein KJS73_05470, partial [Gammaproteobacteria bacterium]|nr:hypothetical protein [Gammaproteobacteria bacterium]